MKKLTESLKRLYQSGKITEERVWELYETGAITIEEKEYILS